MSQLKSAIAQLGGVEAQKVQSPFKTQTFVATTEDAAFDSSLTVGKVYILFVAQQDGHFKASGKPYTKGTWFVVEKQ